MAKAIENWSIYDPKSKTWRSANEDDKSDGLPIQGARLCGFRNAV
jgi:hypothetical protein